MIEELENWEKIESEKEKGRLELRDPELTHKAVYRGYKIDYVENIFDDWGTYWRWHKTLYKTLAEAMGAIDKYQDSLDDEEKYTFEGLWSNDPDERKKD